MFDTAYIYFMCYNFLHIHVPVLLDSQTGSVAAPLSNEAKPKPLIHTIMKDIILSFDC